MDTELDKQRASAGTPVTLGGKRATWLRKTWLHLQLTAVCTFRQKACLSPTHVPFSVGFMGLYAVAYLCVRMSVMPWVLILNDEKCEEAMGMQLSPSLWYGLLVTSLI